MKNASVNNMLRLDFFPVFCFLFLLYISPAAAQSYLVDDGTTHTVNYNGSYQDLTIPSDVTYGQIKLTARGADGGRRHYGFLSCNKKGGGGATAVGTFTIGCGSGQIRPGSTVRFIVGHEGTSASGGTIAGGGGGGGTGILYKAPGSSTWILLAVGGGGGGASMNGVCTGGDGGNGRASTSGQDGGGTYVGYGGSGGGGGEYSTATSGGHGGGGYWGWGSAGTCGGGPGGTTGGQGGDGSCNVSRNGGFGFGGGGTGDQGGGGGGGYSGGGGGDSDNRGGGGGSYVNSIAASSSLTAGSITNSPDAGWCYYQFLNNTGSPIASAHAVCENVTINLENYPSGNATLTVQDLAGDSYVSCGSIEFLVSSYDFSSEDAGHTVLCTVTVEDESGNSSSCVSQVTVKSYPVSKCKDLTVNLNSSGSVTVPVSQVNDGSYDPDGGSVSALFFVFSGDGSSITFNCTNVGTQSQAMFVTDDEGEYTYCLTNITVKDVNVPTVTCKTATLNLGSSGTATLSANSVFNTGSDNCSITTKTVSPNTFTCSNLGANTVTLTVKDASNNAATCTTTVTVVDNTAPTLTCKNATINLNSSGSATLSTYGVYNTGSDNCGQVILLDVTPSAFTCNNIGANTVTLRAGDGHGNQTTCTATVTVADNSAPTGVTCKSATIYLNAAGTATLSPSDVYQSGSDNCGVVTAASVSPSSFSCSPLGGQTVTLTVNDGHGNTATCTAVVTVKDQIAPTAVCQNTTVQLASGSVTVTAASVTGSSTDNCSITARIPTSSTYTATGVYSYAITIKDASGNSSNCTSQVTVQAGLNNPGDRSTEETGNPGAFDFSLSPNPTAGDASVRFELPADQTFVLKVLDMQGRMVLSHEGIGLKGENTFPLHSSNFAQGVYVVCFQSGALRSQKRLVIQQ